MVAMVILGGAWGHHDAATDFGGDTSRAAVVLVLRLFAVGLAATGSREY